MNGGNIARDARRALLRESGSVLFTDLDAALADKRFDDGTPVQESLL